mgnify:CR=1 FL=1
MAFANGSVTLKRFFIQGQSPKQADEALVEQLAERAMGRGGIETPDHTDVGWVSGDHILDTRFDFSRNVIADGLHFALRIDTNKPPTDLLRSYQKQNEQAMLEASGRDFLSNAERREAREQAKSRADKESRSGAFRRMKQYPVFWDLTRNEVYLGTTGAQAAERFMLLFRETFDLPLVPASSGEMAARWATTAGETRTFDDCKPAHFIKPPDGGEIEFETGNFLEGAGRDFLGTEWLTWLWYASHVESPEVLTGLGETVTVLFERSLQLECAFKMTGQLSITADGPTKLEEAPIALASGKRPIRAGLHLAAGGEVFALSIRGDVMHLSSVQLPQVEDVSTPRDVFNERMDKLRTLLDAINGLYNVFLKRRLSGKWPLTLSAMRSWIGGQREAKADFAGAAMTAAS